MDVNAAIFARPINSGGGGMARSVRVFGGGIVAILIWVGVVAVGSREGWWRPLPAQRGDAKAFLDAAGTKIGRESKGNAALVLLEHGRVVGEYFATRSRPVDGDTLFQVASMSKWITAWGVMTLVEKRRIDLDAPVSRYLKRWRLPPSDYNNDDVTVRRLLSHTAGLTDGLGYRGFAPGQKPQTLEASLTHAADAMPGVSGVVRVGVRPGSEFRYSGGGFTLLQLLIEEVSGEGFDDYIRETVLLPLGMTESTFVVPDPAHLAVFYDENGKRAIHYRFTALAAASLYTSTNDLMRFLDAQLKGPRGEPVGRGVLRSDTVELMRHPQASIFGLPIWGLGTILYAPNNAGGFIVGHDGNNYPAINTTARLDPATGDGIIMLETGNGTVASEIGGDWTYWHTGVVDLGVLISEGRRTLIILAAGMLVILVITGAVFWGGRVHK